VPITQNGTTISQCKGIGLSWIRYTTVQFSSVQWVLG